MKIEFGEGCFDGFDGTQEELDELITRFKQLVWYPERDSNPHLIVLEAIAFAIYATEIYLITWLRK